MKTSKNWAIFLQISFLCFIVLVNLISLSFNIKAQESETEFEPGAVVVDRLGFEMVYVPAGTVEMGVGREELVELLEQGAFLADMPESQISSIIRNYETQGVFDTIEVALPAFWIDRYEVTIQQYQPLSEVCIGTGRCSRIDLEDHPDLRANPNQPQVQIDWFDALRLCSARDARLPTEYEWEYAASGPDNLIFPWGNNLIYENLASANNTSTTYRVGSRPNNISWIGAYDMAGNAGEWVEGRLTPYDITSDEWVVWRNRSYFDVYRVIRGGSYATTADNTTSFARSSGHPESGGDTGIRCVRSPDPT
jgi:formylglycine-generating enzyme required for sulfatase activity